MSAHQGIRAENTLDMITAIITPNMEASARSSLHRRLSRQTQRASAAREVPPAFDPQPRRKREPADG